MATKNKKNYTYLKLIGFGILLWLIFKIDVLKSVNMLRTIARPEYLLPALGLMLTNAAVKFIRYRFIMSQQGVKITFLKTAYYSLAAIYLSFITPGRVGEASKAYFIHKETGVPFSRLIAGTVLDRGFDVYTLLFIVITGLAMLSPFSKSSLLIIIPVLIMGSLPFAFLSKAARGMLIKFAEFSQSRLTGGDTWKDHISEFFKEIDILMNRKIFIGFAASIAAYALFFGSCHALSLSLAIPLSFFSTAVFVASANVLSFLPISFAGLGTREAALVYLFSTVQLTGEAALAFSTLVFTFTYILFGMLGFLCLVTIKDEKRMSRL